MITICISVFVYLLSLFSNTLLFHHYFPKALVEDGHVLRSIFKGFIDGLTTFLIYFKEKLEKPT